MALLAAINRSKVTLYGQLEVTLLFFCVRKIRFMHERLDLYMTIYPVFGPYDSRN